MEHGPVVESIRKRATELRERFDVGALYLFGSQARGDAGPTSDADFLVEFAGGATVDKLLDLADFLEELLGMPVDLVTRNGVKARLLQTIEREMIRAA